MDCSQASIESKQCLSAWTEIYENKGINVWGLESLFKARL